MQQDGFSPQASQSPVSIPIRHLPLSYEHFSALSALDVVHNTDIPFLDSAVRASVAGCATEARPLPGIRASTLASQPKLTPIVTFVKCLDTLLPSGIPLGCLTEITGESGSGKTALGLQIAVDVTLDGKYGGVGGSAVWINTAGTFPLKRLLSIGTGLAEHVSNVERKKEAASRSGTAGVGVTKEDVLGGIGLYDVASVDALVDLVSNTLPQVVEVAAAAASSSSSSSSSSSFSPNTTTTTTAAAVATAKAATAKAPTPVKLVVIDNLSFLLRTLPNRSDHTLIATALLTKLNALAMKHNLAVVIMNQNVTKYDKSLSSDAWATGAKDETVPYLDEIYATLVSTRLLCHLRLDERGVPWKDINGDDIREVVVLKSTTNRSGGMATFVVKEEGVRDARHA
jgi:RecA/RadA recombinase